MYNLCTDFLKQHMSRYQNILFTNVLLIILHYKPMQFNLYEIRIEAEVFLLLLKKKSIY